MTDRMMPLNGAYASGRNQLSTECRVVENAFKNGTEILARKTRASQSDAKYQGPVDDVQQSILAYEPVFAVKSTQPKRASAMTGVGRSTMVNSTLNGAFSKKRTLEECYRDIDFRGLAERTALHDSRNRQGHNDTDMVVLRGGTTTTRNTGPSQINAGDMVMWELPDPTAAFAANDGRRASQRLLMWLVPYNKQFDTLTVDAVRQFALNSRDPKRPTLYNASTLGTGDDRDGPLEEGSRELAQALKGAAFMGIETALRAGLVTLNAEGIEAAFGGTSGDASSAFKRRRDAADKYAKRSYNASARPNEPAQDHTRLLAFIAKHLGLITVDGDADPAKQPSRLEVTVNPVLSEPDKKRNMTFNEFLTRSLLATPTASGEYLVNPLSRGNNRVPSGSAGKLLEMQTSIVRRALDGVSYAINDRASRVIGRALSPAASGQEFDILLGHYML